MKFESLFMIISEIKIFPVIKSQSLFVFISSIFKMVADDFNFKYCFLIDFFKYRFLNSSIKISYDINF